MIPKVAIAVRTGLLPLLTSGKEKLNPCMISSILIAQESWDCRATRLRMVIRVKLDTKMMQNFSINENLPFISKTIVKLVIMIDQIRSSRELGRVGRHSSPMNMH